MMFSDSEEREYYKRQVRRLVKEYRETDSNACRRVIRAILERLGGWEYRLLSEED